jgi:outer membrane protein assembly factor BamB
MGRHLSTCAARAAHGAGVALLCALLAGCWWEQPGFGADHSRHNPFEKALRPDNVASLTPQWSVTAQGTFSEPVTNRDLVFSTRSDGGTTGSVQAFDVDSGDVAWEHTLPPSSFASLRPSGAAFVGGDLQVGYYGTNDPFGPPPCGDITRLDPGTGDVLGTERANPPVSSIVTAGPVTAHVEVTGCSPPGGGRLVVRDRATSDVLWRGGNGGAIPPTIDLVQGRIYTTVGSELAAYDLEGCGAATCAPVWTVNLEAEQSGPAIAAGGLVYVFETFVVPLPPPELDFGQGRVRALSAETGADVWQAELAWDFPPGGDAQVYGIAVADGTLYVAGTRQMRSGNGVLEAYDADGCGQTRCEPLWSAPLPTFSGAADLAWPVVAGDVVYAASPGAIVAYDADGCDAPTCTPLAEIPLDDTLVRELSVSAGHVLAVTDDLAGSHTLTALGL